MIKKILSFILILLTHTHVFPDLTDQEIVSILEYSDAIRQSMIPGELSNIEAFLANEDTRLLLFAHPKLNHRYQNKWSLSLRKNNRLWHPQLSHLFSTYDIVNLKKHNIKNYTLILESKDLFPSYLIKLSKYYVSKNRSKPFWCQNISRILYNKLIYELIQKKQLKHIYPLNKCLVHVPNQPTTLSDDNYAVVAEKVTPLYTRRQRIRRFSFLLEQALNKNLKALRFLAEMLFLIKKAWLWDTSPDNIFFIDTYKIAYIDTERFWLKESGQNFFHQSSDERKELFFHSITRFTKLLCGISGVTKKNIALKKKALLLEKKLMRFKGDGDLVEELKGLLLH